MDSPAKVKKDTDLVTFSVTLPAYVVELLQNVAKSRYIRRSQLVRQIIMREIADDPAYTDTILDTPQDIDPKLDTNEGD